MSDQRFNPSLFIILLSTLFLVVLLVPIEYATSQWGINHLGYFDWGVRLGIIFAAIVVSALIVFAGDRPALKGIARGLLLYVVTPLILLTVFYFLRVADHFLGDGILRAREIESGIWLLPTEPLGQITNYLIYLLTEKLAGFSSIQAIELVSYLGGLLYYFASLFLVRSLFVEQRQQIISFVIIFFSGTTLLFCGYAETYMLLPALIALFIATGIRSLEGKLNPLWTLAAFVVMACYHFKCLYFLPCLIFFVYQQRQFHKRLLIETAVALLLCLGVIVFVTNVSILPSPGFKNLLISLTPGGDPYWLLSKQHLLDALNELLLTAGAALIVSFAILLAKRQAGLFLKDRRTLFVGGALPGALAMMTLLHPRLGYAVDWDLFSSTGVVLSIFAITLISASGGLTINRLAQGGVVAVALATFLSYASVNADAEIALARQVEILSLYGETGAIGFETLGNHLSGINNTDGAEQMWKKSVALRPNWRIYANLGQLLREKERFDEAEFYLKKGIAVDSTKGVIHTLLGLVYSKKHQYESAEYHLRRAVELSPSEASFYHNAALCFVEQKRFEDAEYASREALRLNPIEPLYMTLLGAILSNLGNYVEGENYLVQSIKLDPTNSDPYLNLATLYLRAGKKELGIQLLRKYLQRYPNSGDAERVRNVLTGMEK